MEQARFYFREPLAGGHLLAAEHLAKRVPAPNTSPRSTASSTASSRQPSTSPEPPRRPHHRRTSPKIPLRPHSEPSDQITTHVTSVTNMYCRSCEQPRPKGKASVPSRGSMNRGHLSAVSRTVPTTASRLQHQPPRPVDPSGANQWWAPGGGCRRHGGWRRGRSPHASSVLGTSRLERPPLDSSAHSPALAARLRDGGASPTGACPARYTSSPPAQG